MRILQNVLGVIEVDETMVDRLAEDEQNGQEERAADGKNGKDVPSFCVEVTVGGAWQRAGSAGINESAVVAR